MHHQHSSHGILQQQHHYVCLLQLQLQIMSTGLLNHPFFGPIKRYAYNNKYVLQVRHDITQTQNWTDRYQKWKTTFLQNKVIKFLVLPEQITVNKPTEITPQSLQAPPPKRIILYDDFVVTLADQINLRISNNEQFSIPQLWYFLCCLINGAIQLTEIHSIFNTDHQLPLHPQTILVNPYGNIKLLCFYSSPKPVPRKSQFQTPTYQDKMLHKKYLLSATFAVGRVMACLIMLKDLQSFEKEGLFDRLAFDCQLAKHKERIGLLYNIIAGMLQGIPQQRILLHQLSALLFPYERCILNLQGFRLDKGLCRQSMLDILITNSK